MLYLPELGWLEKIKLRSICNCHAYWLDLFAVFVALLPAALTTTQTYSTPGNGERFQSKEARQRFQG